MEQRYLFALTLRYNTGGGIFSGTVTIDLSDEQTSVSGDQSLSDVFEAQGTITFVATDDETLVLSGISDVTEPYNWLPDNANEVRDFANHVRGLGNGNRAITITFNDNASQVFERVNGVYVPIELFERVNGTYVPVEILERVGGVYVS